MFKHDIMASFDLLFMVPASSEETAEVEKELKMSDIEGSHSPGCLLLKRVKSMSTGELHVHLFEDSRQLNLAKNVINEE